jgi:anti-anti-sigma factor
MTAICRESSVVFHDRIPSLLSETESLCLRIRTTLQANGFSNRCFPVELLARECLANALNHGNRRDADKCIELRFSIGRRWIRLVVSDEGEGFCWQKKRHNESDETVPSGRGLLLYSLYADRVQFNRRGNQITLWINKKEPIGKDTSAMAAYVIEQKDQLSSVKLTGDLTAAVVPILQASLKEVMESGVRELAFDLANTTMLDSSGMGLLIASANSLAKNGGKLRVTNVCPDVFRLLQSMRLTARLNASRTSE